MTRATPIIRTIPGGVPSPGLEYTIYLEPGTTELDSGVTDVNGQIIYQVNGSPGPYRWEVVDPNGPDPDVKRVGSSKSAGSGGTYSLYEVPIVLRALLNGVVPGYGDELLIRDVGTTSVAYDPGAVLINGIPGVWYATGSHVVTDDVAQDATHPKSCYLGIEATGLGQTNEGKMVMKAVCGTAAASPELPALAPLQTEASYFLPLASFTLGNTAQTPPNAVTNMTSVRTYIGRRNPLVTATVRRTDLVTPTTTISTGGEDLSGLTTTVTLLSGTVYDVETWGAVLLKAASGQSVSIAPYIDGAANLAEYIGTDQSAEYLLIENAHARSGSDGVLGTGAAINCGMRWKTSSASSPSSALTGILVVRATPRA